MTLMDLVVVALIFGAFALIILSRINKQNPQFIPKVKSWLSGNQKPTMTPDEYSRQIWHEKRQIM